VLLICFRFEIFAEFNFAVTVGTSFVFELSSAKEDEMRGWDCEELLGRWCEECCAGTKIVERETIVVGRNCEMFE
jgi:hypothetical protein